MNIKEMTDIIQQCQYKKGWHINFHSAFGSRPYIQLLVVNSVDSQTGEPVEWKSGKRYVSQHMCKQELVGCVFGLIKDAETHEMHEWFRYKGRAIYNPHLCPDALAELASKASSFNVRENAMSMVEAYCAGREEQTNKENN